MGPEEITSALTDDTAHVWDQVADCIQRWDIWNNNTGRDSKRPVWELRDNNWGTQGTRYTYLLPYEYLIVLFILNFNFGAE